MSAAKEREAFYDAALACPDQQSVNLTTWGTTTGSGETRSVHIWACPAGRRIIVKRISIGVITNAAITSNGVFTVVLRFENTNDYIPIGTFKQNPAARTGFIANFDIGEGCIGETNSPVYVACHGTTGSNMITAGDITVKGSILGEIV